MAQLTEWQKATSSIRGNPEPEFKGFYDPAPAIALPQVYRIELGGTVMIPIEGGNIFEDCVVGIRRSGTSEIRAIASDKTLYIDESHLQFEFTAETQGEFDILLNNDRGEDLEISAAIVVYTIAAEIDEPINLSILKLDSSQDLDIAKDDTGDIRYYKDVVPQRNEFGIYTTAKGYLAFPKLGWARAEESKTVSFIFFCSSDSKYLVFGLASERFNWDSNDPSNAEIALRFRTYRGCYYQYGKTKNNNGGSFAYKGYETFEANNYFRLDIERNGDRGTDAKLYQLPNAEVENWLKGEFVQAIPLIDSPVRSGINIMPFIGDDWDSNNYLLGVITN